MRQQRIIHRRSRAEKAAIALARPQLVVDNSFPSITFVTPHLCAGCGHSTDCSPCHRCGYRATLSEATS